MKRTNHDTALGIILLKRWAWRGRGRGGVIQAVSDLKHDCSETPRTVFWAGCRSHITFSDEPPWFTSLWPMPPAAQPHGDLLPVSCAARSAWPAQKCGEPHGPAQSSLVCDIAAGPPLTPGPPLGPGGLVPKACRETGVRSCLGGARAAVEATLSAAAATRQPGAQGHQPLIILLSFCQPGNILWAPCKYT